MAGYGMENFTIALQNSSKPTIHKKTDANSFLGITWPNTETFSRERHNNKQCVLQ
jgi:hypothetical protein